MRNDRIHTKYMVCHEELPPRMTCCARDFWHHRVWSIYKLPLPMEARRRAKVYSLIIRLNSRKNILLILNVASSHSLKCIQLVYFLTRPIVTPIQTPTYSNFYSLFLQSLLGLNLLQINVGEVMSSKHL